MRDLADGRAHLEEEGESQGWGPVGGEEREQMRDSKCEGGVAGTIWCSLHCPTR